MAYLAIARKWRPHRFEDLVGQGHVVQTLKNAIRFDRVSHAYLFSGARGVGKTSVARIFAKALRCPQAVDAVPCNECAECVSISESRSVDVVEIDGASNNGVEAVRGIRDNVAYGAATGKFKIYIIDEVHMLSISAFNALLKTLEEPPPHVIFLFATTEVQKIPLTILGRCQRFEFRRLSLPQVVERLKVILAAENISVSEEGLKLIGSYSDGSLRDALSLLDQVLSYFSGEATGGVMLDEGRVVEALGVTDTNASWAFLSQVLNKDTVGILNTIQEAYRSGADLKHFAERCLEQLRLLFLVVVTKQARQTITAEEMDLSAGHFQRLEEAAKLATVVQLERMAQILGKTIQQLSWSSLPQFTLEMAAVRLCRLDELAKIEAALLKGEPLGTVDDEANVPAVNYPPPKPAPAKPVLESKPPGPPEPPPPVERAAPPGPQQFENSWKGFVDFVMKRRPLLGALLTHANFQLQGTSTARKFTLAFPEGSFYEKQATEAKNYHDIGEALKAFFGKETTFELSNAMHLAEKSLVQQQDAEVEGLKASALEHPGMLQMKQVLGADLVDVQVDLN